MNTNSEGGLLANAVRAATVAAYDHGRRKLAVEFRIDVVAAGAKRSVAFADLLTRRPIVSVYMNNNTPSCDGRKGVRGNRRSRCHGEDESVELVAERVSVLP